MDMFHLNTTSRNIRMALIIVFIGIVIQILFDPFSGMSRLSNQLQGRISLPEARSKWETQDITHYSFDVSGGIAMVCLFSGNVEVEEGTIIFAGPTSDDNADPDRYLFNSIFWNQEDGDFICDPNIYTVPRMFNEVEYWLTNAPSFPGMSIPTTKISFDPKYGFISYLSFGNCGGRGLLSPIVSDCSGSFSIENFRVLNE